MASTLRMAKTAHISHLAAFLGLMDYRKIPATGSRDGLVAGLLAIYCRLFRVVFSVVIASGRLTLAAMVSEKTILVPLAQNARS
ncbi:hypothetical protein [Glutamicibacter halophytocola]|uniref:Uncharacterized protein n=1 Tax=Glutamicibacter halophytocola TaxID=1933880 RepID=A0AA95BQ00_9MICC|nr:hypothetical protein [Glutamicibacter halophytocola]UUX58720.1 hypothetical protein NUH22_15710 [Glutamicibacter halophytocola]